jgi:peptide/nickel transport system substrate-binding protein
MEHSKLTRRDFLRLSAMAAAGAAIVACQPQTVVVKETVEVPKIVKETVEVEKEKVVEKEVTKVVEKEVTKVVEKEKVVEVEAASGRQSPVFQDLVKAGTLPPLEDRLPVSPKVVREGIELPKNDIDLQIGQFGGTMRTLQPGPNSNALLFISNNEPLVNAPGVGVREPGVIWPNVFKDFKVSSDEKVFTFYMREGMKWSDGEPVTSEDFVFTYEDVLLDDKVTPAFPQWLKSANKAAGEPMKLEAVDTYTIRVTFGEPYGGFLTNLALVSWRGNTELLKPKHYLTQFHVKYTKLEDLEPAIQQAGLAKGEWWALFTQMDIERVELTSPTAVGFPVLYPWMMVNASPTALSYERNPYYWKVDTEGNQLPYIDNVRSEVVQDVQVIGLKVLGGEADFMSYGAGGISLANLALLKENEAKGGYKVVLLGVHNTPTNVILNLTNADPVWQQVLDDVRFRQALNMGINRQEVIDTVYYGFADLPTQVPSEYDPEQANQILDEIGLDKRDADGFRLGSDGKVFEIPFEVAKDADDIVPATELVVEYWNTLGIKTTMKVIESGLLGQRRSANELKANVIWNATLTMWWQIWGMLTSVGWGITWDQWFNSGGEAGEEPPAEAKQFVDLINQSVAVNPESPERQQIIDEYLAILREQLYCMPTAINVKAPLVVNKNMGNIAHDGFAIASYYASELFYYAQ